METRKPYIYHLAAILTVIVWGTTFVSTKVLIGHGLTPMEIFLYRFAIAYAGIWIFSPRKVFADNLKDEMMMIGAGLTGGSLYFMAENSALQYTLAGNVSLIITTAPLLTALLARAFFRSEKLTPRLVWGSVIALLGVALVVFNGSFILRLNPLGDILTLLAALSWAFYSIIMRIIGDKYDTLFITRKIFFYGLVTLVPFIVFSDTELHLRTLGTPAVLMNILFLGIIASLVCFLVWNITLKAIGIVKASNYIYLTPLVTLITSALVIDERITLAAAAGAVLILSGVWIAEKGGFGKKAGNSSRP